MTLTCNEAKKCDNFCCVECIAQLDNAHVWEQAMSQPNVPNGTSTQAKRLWRWPHALTKTITVKYRTNVTDREVEKLPTRDLTSSDLSLKMLDGEQKEFWCCDDGSDIQLAQIRCAHWFCSTYISIGFDLHCMFSIHSTLHVCVYCVVR